MISTHEYKVFCVLHNATRWLSGPEIIAAADGVAPTTVRKHLRKLVGSGLVEQRRVFPGNRYRMSKLCTPTHPYVQNLKAAAETM